MHVPGEADGDCGGVGTQGAQGTVVEAAALAEAGAIRGGGEEGHEEEIGRDEGGGGGGFGDVAIAGDEIGPGSDVEEQVLAGNPGQGDGFQQAFDVSGINFGADGGVAGGVAGGGEQGGGPGGDDGGEGILVRVATCGRQGADKGGAQGADVAAQGGFGVGQGVCPGQREQFGGTTMGRLQERSSDAVYVRWEPDRTDQDPPRASPLG